MGCLIVFRSVTYARNAQNLFTRHHIASSATRPPMELTKGGCSHALRLREQDQDRAVGLLRRSPIPFTGVFCSCGSGWREVAQ